MPDEEVEENTENEDNDTQLNKAIELIKNK
mgnify:FL=1